MIFFSLDRISRFKIESKIGLCKSCRIQRLLITSRSIEPPRSRLIACRVEQIVKVRLFFFRTPCKCLPPDTWQAFISRSPQRGTSEQGEGEKKETAVSILKGQIQIAPAYNLSVNNLGGDRTMLRFCREIRIWEYFLARAHVLVNLPRRIFIWIITSVPSLSDLVKEF